MSLVYDALRQPADAVHAPAATPVPAPRWAWLALRQRPALYLLAGMLVAGPAGYLLSGDAGPDGGSTVDNGSIAAAPAVVAKPAMTTASAAESPVLAQAMQAATMPPATSLDIVPASGTAPVASVAAAASVPSAPAGQSLPEAMPASVQAVAATGMPMPAPAVDAASVPGLATTAAPAADPQPQPQPAQAAATAAAPAPRSDVQVAPAQIQLSVQRRDDALARTTGTTATDEADATAVRGAMSALHAAVGEGDRDATTAAITHLRTLLPAESLTLLRARAWAAHGSGDFAEAERLYSAILERVPDDEHAGVNLALLDARRGELADARARLDRMASRNARSPQVIQALAELDAATP